MFTSFRNIIGASMVTFLVGCASGGKVVDVNLQEEAPQIRTTEFDAAIRKLGRMSKVYGSDNLKIMARQIIDNTGTSIATQAEIPRDITEMIKSTLNAFGGNITYIPYDPEFILNSANTGYSGFNNKLRPDVVVVGGITEFDRGLETAGRNIDIAGEGTKNTHPFGGDFSSFDKNSLANITLDFNLIDFTTLAGIPLMQAVNSIKVRKAVAEDSYGISILGNTFGLKGSMKKVQGRHAAIRLLVQISMIQLIGKKLNLPYWRLLPESKPDPVVLESLQLQFEGLSAKEQVSTIQKYLVLHGYDLQVSGTFDQATQAALNDFAANNADASNAVDQKAYVALYTSVPLTKTVAKKRLQLEKKDTTASGISDDGVLRVWTNSQQMRVGQPMKIFFKVTSPRYVSIYSRSSTGEVWKLFPNDYQKNEYVSPGLSYQVPPRDNTFMLEVTGPAGTDRIIAVGSQQPLPKGLNVLAVDGSLTAEAQGVASSVANLDIQIRE